MGALEALILGLIQGLTEFLPVSSSGHLEIAKALMGVDIQEDLTFTVVVHGATVLSTLCVFWSEIAKLTQGFFRFRWNDETRYVSLIAVSMIPVMIIGLFFKDEVESLFGQGLLIVGCALVVTAGLLTFAHFSKEKNKKLGFRDALIIGSAQAIAIIPGLSRSGTTIATGLLLGNKKSDIAQFSFLMVLIPILGENILSLLGGDLASSGIGTLPLVIGFVAAFASGFLACKWMINLVKKGKLIYFALYCLVAAILAFILS